MQNANQHMNRPFADILEECRQRLARSETIRGCLAAYPAHAAELQPLLPLVLRTQRLARDPEPAYAARTHRRFYAALAAEQAARRREPVASPFSWFKRLVVPLAVVIVMTFSGLGLVEASNDALPDSPLYTVKRAREGFEQVLVRNPQDAAALQLRLAKRRRLELERAESLHKPPALQLTVAANMVERSNAATEQVLQNQGAQREQQLTELRQLLPAEREDMNSLVTLPRSAFATTARDLQKQLLADEQKVAAK